MPSSNLGNQNQNHLIESTLPKPKQYCHNLNVFQICFPPKGHILMLSCPLNGRIMASNKKKNKGSPKKDTLQKHFQKGKAGPSTATAAAAACLKDDGPSRQQTGLFLTYLRVTAKGKDEASAEKAAELSKHYHTLDITAKKQLIQEFFRVGGKKAGLGNCFCQAITTKEAASEGTWRGYVTPSKMMELEGVSWEISEQIMLAQ